MQKKKNNSCNSLESPFTETSELRPFHVRIAKIIPNKIFTFKSRIKYDFMRNMNGKNLEQVDTKSENLNHEDLIPGDWVEVRSLREIALTLNEDGKLKGLYFMPEMEEFCGKTFKIFKKAEKIKLESNGELRNLKNPSYFLEGVFCNGFYQGGCDRSCFHYWRAEWLKKIPE